MSSKKVLSSEKSIEALYDAILKIDGKKNPSLKEWNVNYFNEHKNRYVEEIEEIKQLYKGGKIIEIGSLPCHITYLLKHLDFDVTGIDINPERCETFIKANDLKVIQCDIEKSALPFEDGTVELIIFSEIFEHLRINPIETLKELNRILSKNGTMLLTTPNLYSLRNIIFFNLGRSLPDPFEEFSKLETVGHMGHIREYSKRDVKKFLENTGFTIIKHEFKNYKKSKRILLGIFIDLFHGIFKRFKPYQLFVCKKNLC